MKILRLVGMAVLVIPGLVFAGSNTNKGASPNGKPFVELNGAIVEVEGEVSELQDQMDLLAGRVTNLEDRVTANENAIANLEVDNAGLQVLIDANAADVLSLETRITELYNHNAELQTQINEWGDPDNGLQAQIDANDSDIITLAQTIDTLEGNLQEAIDHNTSLISALQQQIVDINESLAMKQMIISGTCPEGENLHEIQEDGSVVCATAGGGSGSSVTQLRVRQYCNSGNYNYGCGVYAFCPAGSLLTGGAGYSYNSYGYGTDNRPVAWTTADVEYYNQNYPNQNYGQAWYAYSNNNYYYSNYTYAIALCLQFN
jgi:uncharacterized coiled-coil protein SlyX